MAKTPAQFLRPLLLNQHWGLFEEYLAGEKTRLVLQLCNCNENQLKDLQGQIRTIESLLRLKETLRTETGSNR